MFSKTIAVRFLKVQNKWVVLKTKQSFLKRNKKRLFNKHLQKRLTTLIALYFNIVNLNNTKFTKQVKVFFNQLNFESSESEHFMLLI